MRPLGGPTFCCTEYGDQGAPASPLIGGCFRARWDWALGRHNEKGPG